MSTIKSIIKKKITNETLWNLAVEGDESYVANGVVVHNCRSVLIPITRFEDWSADGVTNSGRNVDKFLEENVSDKGFSVYTNKEVPTVVTPEPQITDSGVSFKTVVNDLTEVITYSKLGKVFEIVTTTYDNNHKILSVDHERTSNEAKI